MNNIKSVDKDIINENDSDLVNILLFGSSKMPHQFKNTQFFNIYYFQDRKVLQSAILKTVQCQ